MSNFSLNNPHPHQSSHTPITSSPKISTIYVGDLSHTTTEQDLLRLFSSAGKIQNIKLVKNDSHSSCYAYINFEKYNECEKAVKLLNFVNLNGVSIRVMHFIPKNKKSFTSQSSSNDNKAVHYSSNNSSNSLPTDDNDVGKVNSEYTVIVQNLPSSCTNRTLFDTFNLFGDITSCKIMMTANNQPKGFGFVSYKDKISMKKAIKFANNTFMDNNALKVSKFEKKSERESKANKIEEIFTNCYVKNFSFNEIELSKLLSIFGKVTSFFVPRKVDGSLKGTAFCNFETHESAVEAIKALHSKTCQEILDLYGKIIKSNTSEEESLLIEKMTGININNSNTNIHQNENINPYDPSIISDENDKMQEIFYIQRAQPKTERTEQLRAHFQNPENIESSLLSKPKPKTNLYITGIPEGFTQQDIKNAFSTYGQITSILVGKDTNTNTQFSYINYSCPEEAAIAIEKGHEMLFDNKKIAIQYFKTKKERERLDMNSFGSMVGNLKKEMGIFDNEYMMKHTNGSVEMPLFNNWAYDKNFSMMNNDNVYNKNGNEYNNGYMKPMSNFISPGYDISSNEMMMMHESKVGFGNNNGYNNNNNNVINNSYSSIQDKKMMGGDLYGLVLSMSGIFQDEWKKMGIQDEYAFADRITKLLMNKPANEVRNMMGLGNVLSQNITEVLKELNKKNTE